MKTCSSCKHWQPEERADTGSISYRMQDPYCKQIFEKGKPKAVYAETKACWLWKERED